MQFDVDLMETQAVLFEPVVDREDLILGNFHGLIIEPAMAKHAAEFVEIGCGFSRLSQFGKVRGKVIFTSR